MITFFLSNAIKGISSLPWLEPICWNGNYTLPLSSPLFPTSSMSGSEAEHSREVTVKTFVGNKLQILHSCPCTLSMLIFFYQSSEKANHSIHQALHMMPTCCSGQRCPSCCPICHSMSGQEEYPPWPCKLLHLDHVSLMSTVVLQLFPMSPAHVAGSSTPLHNIVFSEQMNQIQTLHLISWKARISYHSQGRRKCSFQNSVGLHSLVYMHLRCE
jgi:hypothetical protein